MEKPQVINVHECDGCHVPKGWGHEIIFENNEKRENLKNPRI